MLRARFFLHSLSKNIYIRIHAKEISPKAYFSCARLESEYLAQDSMRRFSDAHREVKSKDERVPFAVHDW